MTHMIIFMDTYYTYDIYDTYDDYNAYERGCPRA